MKNVELRLVEDSENVIWFYEDEVNSDVAEQPIRLVSNGKTSKYLDVTTVNDVTEAYGPKLSSISFDRILPRAMFEKRPELVDHIVIGASQIARTGGVVLNRILPVSVIDVYQNNSLDDVSPLVGDEAVGIALSGVASYMGPQPDRDDLLLFKISYELYTFTGKLNESVGLERDSKLVSWGESIAPIFVVLNEESDIERTGGVRLHSDVFLVGQGDIDDAKRLTEEFDAKMQAEHEQALADREEEISATEPAQVDAEETK